jgi:hypothetical protein
MADGRSVTSQEKRMDAAAGKLVEERKRPWYRLHLSTGVVLLFTVAVLVLLTRRRCLSSRLALDVPGEV